MNREERERTKAGWKRPPHKKGLKWPCKVEVGMKFIYLNWGIDAQYTGHIETVYEIVPEKRARLNGIPENGGSLALNSKGFPLEPELWQRVE